MATCHIAIKCAKQTTAPFPLSSLIFPRMSHRSHNRHVHEPPFFTSCARQTPRTPPKSPQILYLLGSNLATSALVASPSITISAIKHPVPGPFWIPQHVCPAATHSPGTVVSPTSGGRSSPNRMCRGR